MLTAQDFSYILRTMLDGAVRGDSETLNETADQLYAITDDSGVAVVSYADAGVLTDDAGFIIRLASGTEFQVTIRRR